MHLVDKDGDWFVNRSQFPMPHGLRAGVVFSPMVPTRVALDDWIVAQAAVLKECTDPTSAEAGELPEPIPTSRPNLQQDKDTIVPPKKKK